MLAESIPPDAPIEALVEAYVPGRLHPYSLERLNLAAWQAFHDPWEVPPRVRGYLPLPDPGEPLVSQKPLSNLRHTRLPIDPQG